jgi:hypothetical protein
MIGRKKELRELESLCLENESKLAVVQGRRRIGKTYLIDYMFQEHRKDCLFFNFEGDYEGDKTTQLKNFQNSIHSWFKKTPKNNLSDWTDAFYFLWQIINEEIKEKNHNGKVVIFLDEVPCINKDANSGFLSALGYFWNHYCLKSKNFILILCGSNSSWINNKIIKDKNGPLHKRVDKIIGLKPFTIRETKEYLVKEKNYDADDMSIIDAYMIFGGVAKYLSYLDKNLLMSQNIDRIFFSLEGQLYDEYETLFETLFAQKGSFYKSVIDALSQKKSGLTKQEISKKLNIGQTDPRIKTALDDLYFCGFINALSRYNNKTKGIKYIISDNYCLFYKKWIEPLNKNDIARLDNYWSKQLDSNSYRSWSGFAFELICMNNIDFYLQQRGLKEFFIGVSYWDYKPKDPEEEDGAQIDLLIEYSNNIYEIVECKYSDKEFVITKDYLPKLLNKKEVFKKYGISSKRYDIKMSMLTTFGTKQNSHYEKATIGANIKLCDLLG